MHCSFTHLILKNQTYVSKKTMNKIQLMFVAMLLTKLMKMMVINMYANKHVKYILMILSVLNRMLYLIKNVS